jgi:hypothetical protein
MFRLFIKYILLFKQEDEYECNAVEGIHVSEDGAQSSSMR